MLLWLIFLTLNSYSQSVEKFCFHSVARKSSAIKTVSPLLLPSDKITAEDECFTLVTSPHRRELLQRYILNHDPEARIAFSSEEKRRDPCRLKIEKVKKSATKEIDASLHGAHARDVKDEGREISKIQTSGEFDLRLNQNVIEGDCRYITPERYEIKLNVRKEPKPIYPQASPGVIIVINGAPPDQETSNLTTTVQLQRGERIQIGSIAKNETQDKRRVDIRPHIKMGNRVENGSEEIYLSID